MMDLLHVYDFLGSQGKELRLFSINQKFIKLRTVANTVTILCWVSTSDTRNAGVWLGFCQVHCVAGMAGKTASEHSTVFLTRTHNTHTKFNITSRTKLRRISMNDLIAELINYLRTLHSENCMPNTLCLMPMRGIHVVLLHHLPHHPRRHVSMAIVFR